MMTKKNVNVAMTMEMFNILKKENKNINETLPAFIRGILEIELVKRGYQLKDTLCKHGKGYK